MFKGSLGNAQMPQQRDSSLGNSTATCCPKEQYRHAPRASIIVFVANFPLAMNKPATLPGHTVIGATMTGS